MISLEKQISDIAEGLKDVVTKSELADMMNSFVSDDDDKWLMFNAKFSSADEVCALEEGYKPSYYFRSMINTNAMRIPVMHQI